MHTPAVIAHRGYAGVAPDNTIAAALAAAEREGTAMIEIDVQPAACGTPVVFHDERLDGTREGRPVTEGSGLVWETPLETLESLSVLGTDESIPTLSALLEAVPETVGINVELKNPGATELRVGESLSADALENRRGLWRPFVERVLEDCEAFDGELLFSSFCEGALAALRDTGDHAAAPLVRDDCEAIHPPRNAVAGTALASEPYYGLPTDEPSLDIVELAHEEGRAVNVWTVDSWLQFDDLAAAGVDGIVADYPGLEARAGAGTGTESAR